jgi:hypothetical protein
VQEQVTVMQQNLRAGMYTLCRDIQMAGYYTNAENTAYSMDWDDLGNNESIRPMLYARDNVDDDAGGDGVRDDTDTITLVMAGDDQGVLAVGESASGNTINLGDLDLDNDGDADFALPARSYGLLVTSDLNAADFFQIQSIVGSSLTTTTMLSRDYEPGDFIFRADVILYRVDDEDDPGNDTDNDDPTYPKLRRRNLGSDNGFQAVAEGIDQIQFRYLLANGTWVDDPAGNEANVRAVEVFLLARTAKAIRGYTNGNTYVMGNGGYHGGAPSGGPPNDGFRRKLLSSIICTRNIGL